MRKISRSLVISIQLSLPSDEPLHLEYFFNREEVTLIRINYTLFMYMEMLSFIYNERNRPSFSLHFFEMYAFGIMAL